MRELDRMRLDQIFKTIERTMQFVSFCNAFPALERQFSRTSLKFPITWLKELETRMQCPKHGKFYLAYQGHWEAIPWGNGQEWFMPEM